MVITILPVVVVARARGTALQSEKISLLQHQAHVQKSSSEEKEALRTEAWAETALFTMHGCECADNWHYDGLTLHGCVFTDEHDLPWCFVKDAAACQRGYNKSLLLTVGDHISTGVCSNATGCDVTTEKRDGTWDFCTLPEEVDTHFSQSSCHCLPVWEHNRQLYSGCAQPDGVNSSAWCHVAESNCAGSKVADAKGNQKWDDCAMPSSSPVYVTRHSCHCKPAWEHEGKKQTSCAPNKLLKPPDVLVAINATLEEETIYGWCHVFEDERECPGAIKVGGHHMDVCFLVDEADVADLETTLHGCHCSPEWGLDGIVYKGCSQTHGVAEEEMWCRVVEDESICPNSLGPEQARAGGAGRGIGRWDWCTPKGKDQDWRLPDERFTPKEPDPPAWYQEFRIDHNAGRNDLEE